ncbi:Uma2 family endonuclease [Dyadobacter psychrotolerans]|uniref:Uma2 family endonuclease n=1 Tax=Dyadobacter psychrotolerans TaxID=2541721 RepID=A0A4R5DXI0_9BACT|nr:Uma2 family endonuclease [Dyadobacter psychrotolerans]TDE18637.1 Uma2 family endonuclease [Dyadobacter psychrotolerans]
MTAQPQKFYSEEEYLEMEREAEYKSEYYRGEIFAMAGAGHNHNRINENISIIVGNYLKGKSCRSYSRDLRVHIHENGLYTYPDFLIVCGENKFRDDKRDTLLNPVVIIEILSESTSDYDRGEKFRFYRSLTSLKEYVTVNSLSVSAEVFRKNEENDLWFLASDAYSLEESIMLSSVDLKLNMTDIYEQTEGILPVKF